MSSSQLTFITFVFFRGVGQPPTSKDVVLLAKPHWHFDDQDFPEKPSLSQFLSSFFSSPGHFSSENRNFPSGPHPPVDFHHQLVVSVAEKQLGCHESTTNHRLCRWKALCLLLTCPILGQLTGNLRASHCRGWHESVTITICYYRSTISPCTLPHSQLY